MVLKKVARSSFGTGAISLFVDDVCQGNEVSGELRLRLQIPTYMRGIYIKLTGNNSITVMKKFSCRNGLTEERLISKTWDVLKGHEDHHHDGIQEGKGKTMVRFR